MDWHCYGCKNLWRIETNLCSGCGAETGYRVRVRSRPNYPQNLAQVGNSGVTRDARLTIPTASGRHDTVIALSESSDGVDKAPTSSILPSERSIADHENVLPSRPCVVGPVFPPHRTFVVSNPITPPQHASNSPLAAQTIGMSPEHGPSAMHTPTLQQSLSRPQLRSQIRPAPQNFRIPNPPPEPPLRRTPEGTTAPPHDPTRGRGGTGRRQKVEQLHHLATNVASYNNVLSKPAFAKSVAYKDLGEPRLASIRCSKNNQDIWPFCFSPIDNHREGKMRQKTFPNCACQVQDCNRPHPTKMHHLMYDFIEVWVTKLTIGIGKDTKCDTCGRLGEHTTEDHGLGEWRDHHDTDFHRYGESMPYAEFAHPWYEVWTGRTPLPREFFFKESEPEEGTLVHADFLKVMLKYDFLKHKLKYGMWEVDLKAPDLGLEASLRKAAKTHEWYSNVNDTNTRPEAPKIKSRKSANEAECIDGSPALHKPARSDEQADPRDKEAKQGLVQVKAHQQSSTPVVDAWLGLPHHKDLPKPGWYPDSDQPLNHAFITLVSRILNHEDNAHLRVLLTEMKDISERRYAIVHRIKIAKQTWELLEPYVPDWVPDCLQSFQNLPSKLRDRLDQRADERKRLTYTRKFDGLSKDCGFVPRDNHRVECYWDENDQMFSDKSQFHPQIFPESDAPAEAHIRRWGEFTLERCSEAVFNDFKAWYNEVPRSIVDAEIAILGDAKPELLEVWEYTARTVVDSMLSHVEELRDRVCWDRLSMKFGVRDLARMKAIAATVRSRFMRYAEQLETTLKTLDNEEAKGLGAKLRGFTTDNTGSAWLALRGHCLPYETPDRACIPRIAWPADFEKWRMERTGEKKPWKGEIEYDAAESNQESEASTT